MRKLTIIIFDVIEFFIILILSSVMKLNCLQHLYYLEENVQNLKVLNPVLTFLLELLMISGVM